MPAASSVHEFGLFRLDSAERLLLREGQPVSLTPKAFDLLVYLVDHAGRLVTKQALMSALWPDSFVEEANLTFTVSALRKALGDGQDGEQFIQTVPTRGYRFVAPVTHDEDWAGTRPFPRHRLVLSSLSFAQSRPSLWRLPSSPCCSSSSDICAKGRMSQPPRGSPFPCRSPHRPSARFPWRQISPDGRRVALIAASRVAHLAAQYRRLWLRCPSRVPKARRSLFWAPDSQQLAFSTTIAVEEA